jgi:hypothetical protein
MRKRSKHDLSHYKQFTCNQGELVPIAVQEVLPGDTFQMSTNALVRLSPLVAPVMHPVHATIQHFFVPYRLIMDDWESFITGGETGADSTTFPTINITPAAGTLADYFGLPLGTAIDVNALPFRAYSLIYNEYFRNQDLQAALTIDTTDGADTTTNVALKYANWAKDRFTSSKDSSQKGSEISLPLGTEAPVTGFGKDSQTFTNTNSTVYESGGSSSVQYANASPIANGTNTTFYVEQDPNNTGYPNVKADLTNATAASINDLREAFALQSFAEHRMMFGGRYSEYLKFLGINYSDGRLDRPEYLGGGKQTIQFSEVLQTGVDSTDAGLGTLGGHGITAMKSNRFRKFFEEHGLIMSLMCVKPKPMYHQGVHKLWSKTTKEDFFQYELEGIGQEEVLNKEVYVGHTTPSGTFGWQNRYDEYRHAVDTVAGDFRPGQSLEEWTMCRDFSSDPSLNSSFVTCNPTNRIYASTATDQLLIMAYHNVKARRLMRKIGQPIGLLGA